MGFWDTLGQGALDVGTLGADRIPGAGNFFFGGDATKSIDAMPGNYTAATNQLGQLAQSAGGRAAPVVTAAQLDPSNLNQSRAGLLSTAQGLGRIASGQQAGAGELAVNRQVGQATAAQAAAARMARGANAALAYRNAARNTADIGLGGAGAAATAQMADQQAANAQLASVYGGMYGQDANVAQANAQLMQGASLANQQATLTSRGQNDALQIQALGQQLGWDQARINDEIQKAQVAAGDKGIFPSLLQVAGSIGAAAATGGASAAIPHAPAAPNYQAALGSDSVVNPYTMSDVRLKNSIQSGQGAADRAVATLAPLIFGFNNPQYGTGAQLGTSTQDLERAGLGHVVIDTPKGKAIDGGKLSTTNTAMIAALGNRLAALEGGAAPAAPAPVPLPYGPPGAASNAYQAYQADELAQRRAMAAMIARQGAMQPGSGSVPYIPPGAGGSQLVDAGGQ